MVCHSGSWIKILSGFVKLNAPCRFENRTNISGIQVPFCKPNTSNRKYPRFTVPLVIITLFSAIFTGCRREPAPEKKLSHIKQPVKIRVLLEKNCKNIWFESESSAEIICPKSRLNSIRFDSPKNSVKISTVDKKINIGGWDCPDSKMVIRTANKKFSVNGQRYRGSLEIELAEDANRLDIINIVGLESYLAGVTGAEMPSYWETSALKAQTIAARSYALYVKRNLAEHRTWDVKKTQANQVYKGISGETSRVIEIVKETRGQTLFYTSPDTGNYRILPAYYSSICGGHTESSQNVFSGDAIPPLKGVRCPYCRQLASPDFFHWGSFTISKSECSRKLIGNYPSLKKLNTITDIRIKKQKNYENISRVISVTLEGKNGKKDTIKAEDFRLTLDASGMKFRSTIFEIKDADSRWVFENGIGFGHGVGLCQYGTEQMARKGKTYLQILKHYYPGAVIRNIYEN